MTFAYTMFVYVIPGSIAFTLLLCAPIIGYELTEMAREKKKVQVPKATARYIECKRAKMSLRKPVLQILQVPKRAELIGCIVPYAGVAEFGGTSTPKAIMSLQAIAYAASVRKLVKRRASDATNFQKVATRLRVRSKRLRQNSSWLGRRSSR